MRNPNISKYNELQKFCDALEETDLACDECAIELKKSIRLIFIDNPTWFMDAGDIDLPPNTKLHASCAVRLLAVTKSFFDSDRIRMFRW